eukprot:CAMPEP_0176318630 /NCGR_PEP_ID=MMETSP0121_2-20121125/69877_1 /TAXON_ID=160619 /ORGANISM="Kryptoperidinium foliaceum, Strain CCMP 1326" /LENGTH=59 /DNA_ID=CAMNT_0017660937 /DNA_START=330 /DNA_END=509 /DNA_ORIENTATION=+
MSRRGTMLKVYAFISSALTGGENDLPEIKALGPDRPTAGILDCAPVIIAKPPPKLWPVT